MSETVTALRDLVRTFPSALLGYSGGVDSAYLAVVLRQELGPHRMVAVIGRSASYPQAQWAAARAVAERFDVPLIEIATRARGDPLAARRSRNDENGDSHGIAQPRAPDVGRARGAVPVEPRRLRPRHHAAPARSGGAGGGVPARHRRDRRSSRAPLRRARPH